jgi:hypothetical protein
MRVGLLENLLVVLVTLAVGYSPEVVAAGFELRGTAKRVAQ